MHCAVIGQAGVVVSECVPNNARYGRLTCEPQGSREEEEETPKKGKEEEKVKGSGFEDPNIPMYHPTTTTKT